MNPSISFLSTCGYVFQCFNGQTELGQTTLRCGTFRANPCSLLDACARLNLQNSIHQLCGSHCSSRGKPRTATTNGCFFCVKLQAEKPRSTRAKKKQHTKCVSVTLKEKTPEAFPASSGRFGVEPCVPEVRVKVWTGSPGDASSDSHRAVQRPRVSVSTKTRSTCRSC